MKLPLGQAWCEAQPYYVAYCLEHNAASPDEMLAFDMERYPGGCMGGYIVWNGRKWRDWAAIVGIDINDRRTTEEREEFESWLLLEAFSEWLLLENEASPRSSINSK